jgi:LysR family transcriptional regulator, benzoate and cis,cis-muconate-responsive activator of ben and cat genes
MAARLGSISKAAAALHTTQPSLSRQIAALERKLRCELFVRTPKGVLLTAAGVGLQRHLDVVFAQLDQLPEVVRVAAQRQELVRIGLPQGLPETFMLAFLRAAKVAMPEVSVSLSEATTDEQRLLLQSGLIDLGLIHTDSPELNCAKVLTQRMGVAVPGDSPLAQVASLEFAHLDGLKVMAHAAGEVNAEESRLRAASETGNVVINWVFRRFSDYSTLIAMTSEVDAVLVTQVSAARHLPSWTWIPVSDAGLDRQALDVHTWAAWREPSRPHLAALVEIMRSASVQ